ncbi:conjugal transfer protein TraI [Alistipes finegoldii]|uniref:Conjugal transfer protein TraI n=1 Tax=Alistipes finegoldii TaxID=214856 RepID=A0AAE4LKX4_9BACT|nr:conjugal transfer protein TraI [Alistipes finegoldii]MDU0259646.1 conjugal transfer protein TraI [Alistipes finegoldii]
MNRLILLVESRIRGDVYVRFGGELPKTHRSNTAGRWMLSLPLKSVHNIIKDARKVKLTLEMVSEITEIYTSGFNRMVSDPNFTVDELAAISAGYARLLEEGGALVAELKTVITGGNGLSLSDKERMDVVDQVYTKMLEYRNLTRYYTRKTISVSFIRGREKGDAHRVLALYGNPNDRYW